MPPQKVRARESFPGSECWGSIFQLAWIEFSRAQEYRAFFLASN